MSSAQSKPFAKRLQVDRTSNALRLLSQGGVVHALKVLPRLGGFIIHTSAIPTLNSVLRMPQLQILLGNFRAIHHAGGLRRAHSSDSTCGTKKYDGVAKSRHEVRPRPLCSSSKKEFGKLQSLSRFSESQTLQHSAKVPNEL